MMVWRRGLVYLHRGSGLEIPSGYRWDDCTLSSLGAFEFKTQKGSEWLATLSLVILPYQP